ncbi:MAG: ABC transporter permease [Planctomycetota bacterium]
MRSLLSLLGLTVAIVGMVGLFSVAQGIDRMVHNTFKAIPGLAVLQPGAPIPLFSRLPRSWGDEIAKIDGVHEVNAEIWSRAHVIEGRPVFSPPRFLFGTDIPSRLRMNFAVYREHMIKGRFLSLDDIGTYRAVISKAIAEEFQIEVGDTLHVDGQDLEIVGIYHCGSLLLDVAIILDIGQVRPLARMEGPFVSAFYIEPQSNVDRDDLTHRIENQFRGRNAPTAGSPMAALSALDQASSGDVLSGVGRLLTSLLPPPKPKNVAPQAAGAESTKSTAPTTKPRERKKSAKARRPELGVDVRGSEDWAQEFQRFSADLDIFLLALTSIGITIAVLSIINTMLMSVTERFIEFGILKANGWTNRNVLLLITFESALLGLSGGILGALLGWIATLVVNANWNDRINLHASPQLLLFAVGFSTVLGILGGLYPAIWASRMMPMDAIRRG